ncbi:unnamed protein product [Parnassius apollo]|uniref:(apollo) hypothetical protein n=1 Tax=Parnassius apollo TaxID=110799 RepID=A0A8S3WGU7_PARAO|nr:unnamed protein product [Parnassius apollo]
MESSTIITKVIGLADLHCHEDKYNSNINIFDLSYPQYGKETSGSIPSTTEAPISRHPFRVAIHRRPVATTNTTSINDTTQSITIILDNEKLLKNIEETDSIEDLSINTRSNSKNRMTQRLSIKVEQDQNPAATREEEKNRQSKSYSSSLKQSEVLTLKAHNAYDIDIDPKTNGKFTVEGSFKDPQPTGFTTATNITNVSRGTNQSTTKYIEDRKYTRVSQDENPVNSFTDTNDTELPHTAISTNKYINTKERHTAVQNLSPTYTYTETNDKHKLVSQRRLPSTTSTEKENFTDTSSRVRPSTGVYTENFEKITKTPFTSADTVITTKKYSEVSLQNSARTTGQTGTSEKFTETSSSVPSHHKNKLVTNTRSIRDSAENSDQTDTAISNKKYSDLSLQNSGRTTGQTGISEKFTETSSSVKPSTDIESETFEKTRTLLTKYTGAIRDSAGTLKNSDQSLRHTDISEKFTETSSSVRSSTDIHPEIFENTGTLTTKYTDAIRDSAATSQNSGQTNVKTVIITDTSSSVRPSTRVYSETFEKTVKTPLTSSGTVITSKKYSEESLKNSSQTTGQTDKSEKFTETSSRVRPSTNIYSETIEKTGPLTSKYTDAISGNTVTLQNSGQTTVQKGIREKFTDTSSRVRPSTGLYSEPFEKIIKTPYTSADTVITNKKYSDASLQNSGQTTGQTGISEKFSETSSSVKPSTDMESATFEKTRTLLTKYTGAIRDSAGTLQNSDQSLRHTGISEKLTETSSSVRPSTDIHQEAFENTGRLTTKYTDAIRDSAATSQNSGQTNVQTVIITDTSSSVRPSTRVYSETFEKTVTTPLTSSDTVITSKKYSEESLKNSSQTTGQADKSEKFTETSSRIRPSKNVYSETFEKTGPLTTNYTDAISGNTVTLQNSGQTTVQKGIREKFTDTSSRVRPSTGTLKNFDQSLRHTDISEKFTETSSSVRSSTDIHPDIFENTGTLTTKYTDAIRDSAATSQNSGQTNVKTVIITDTSSSVRPSTRVYSETFEKTVKTPLTSSGTVITSIKYSEESLKNSSQTTGQTDKSEKFTETSSRVRPSTNIYSETIEKTGPLTTNYTDAISGNTVTLQNSGQTTVQKGIREKFTDTSSRVRPSTGVYSETFEKITKTPYTSADTVITNKKYSDASLQNSGQTTGQTGISEKFSETSSSVKPSRDIESETFEKTRTLSTKYTGAIRDSAGTLQNSDQSLRHTGISEKLTETSSSVRPSTDIHPETIENTGTLTTKYSDSIRDSAATSQNSGQNNVQTGIITDTSSVVQPSKRVYSETFEKTVKTPLTSSDTVITSKKYSEESLRNFSQTTGQTGIREKFTETSFRVGPSTNIYSETFEKTGPLTTNYTDAFSGNTVTLQNSGQTTVQKGIREKFTDTSSRVRPSTGVYSETFEKITKTPYTSADTVITNKKDSAGTLQNSDQSLRHTGISEKFTETSSSVRSSTDIHPEIFENTGTLTTKYTDAIRDSAATSQNSGQTNVQTGIITDTSSSVRPSTRVYSETFEKTVKTPLTSSDTVITSKKYSEESLRNFSQTTGQTGIPEKFTETSSRERPSTNIYSETFEKTGPLTTKYTDAISGNTVNLQSSGQTTVQKGIREKFTDTSSRVRPSTGLYSEPFEKIIKTPYTSADTVITNKKYSDVSLQNSSRTTGQTGISEKFTETSSSVKPSTDIESETLEKTRTLSTKYTGAIRDSAGTLQNSDQSLRHTGISEKFTETSSSVRSSTDIHPEIFENTGTLTTKYTDAIRDSAATSQNSGQTNVQTADTVITNKKYTDVSLQNSGRTTGQTGISEKFTETSSSVNPSTDIESETFEKTRTLLTKYTGAIRDSAGTLQNSDQSLRHTGISEKFTETSSSVRSSTDIHPEIFENTGILTTKYTDAIRDSAATSQNSGQTNVQTGIITDTSSSVRPSTRVYSETFEKTVKTPLTSSDTVITSKKYSEESLKNFSQTTGQTGIREKFTETSSRVKPSTNIYSETFEKTGPLTSKYTDAISGNTVTLQSSGQTTVQTGIREKFTDTSSRVRPSTGRTTGQTGISEKFSETSSSVKPSTDIESETFEKNRTLSTKYTGAIRDSAGTLQNSDQSLRHTGISEKFTETSSSVRPSTDIHKEIFENAGTLTTKYTDAIRDSAATSQNSGQTNVQTGIITDTSSSVRPSTRVYSETFEKTVKTPLTSSGTVITSKKYSEESLKNFSQTTGQTDIREKFTETSSRVRPSTNIYSETFEKTGPLTTKYKDAISGNTVTLQSSGQTTVQTADTVITNKKYSDVLLQNSGRTTGQTGISEKFSETSSSVKPSTDVESETFEKTRTLLTKYTGAISDSAGTLQNSDQSLRHTGISEKFTETSSSVRSSTDINPEIFENTGTLTTKYTDSIRDSAATSQNSGQTNVQTGIITDTSSSVRPSTRVYSETFEKTVKTPLTSSGTVITSKKYSEESLKNFSQTTGQTDIREKFTETSSRVRPSTNIYSETLEKTGPLTSKYTDAISGNTVTLQSSGQTTVQTGIREKFTDTSSRVRPSTGRTTGQTGISEKFSETSSSVKPSIDIESETFEKNRTLLTKYTGAIRDSAGTLQNSDQSLRHTGISEKFTETSSSVRPSTDIHPEIFENTGTLTTKYTDAIRDSAATSQNSGQTNVQTVIITDTSSSVRPSTRVYSETFEKTVTTPLTSSDTVITSKKYSEESLRNFSQTTGQTDIREKLTETSSRVRPSTNIYSETFEKTGPLTTKYKDAISGNTVTLQSSGQTTVQTGIREKFTDTSSRVRPSTGVYSETFEKITKTPYTSADTVITNKKYSDVLLQNSGRTTGQTGISEKFSETSSSVKPSTDVESETLEKTRTLSTKYTGAISDSAGTLQNSDQSLRHTGISEKFTEISSSVRSSTDIHPEIFENAGTLTTKYTDANRDSAATSQNSGQTNVQTGIITDTSSSVRPSTRVYSETFEKTVKTPLTSSDTVITSKKYSEESLKNFSQTTGQTDIREKFTETSSRVRPSTNIYSETFEKTGPLTTKYKDAISGNTVTLQSSSQTTVQTGIREKFTDTSSRVRPSTGVYSETFEKITKTPYTSADTVITNKKYSDVLLQNSGRTTGQTGITEKFSETSSSVKPSTDIESETFEKNRTLLTKYTGAISDSAGTLQNSDQSLRHTGISEKFTQTSSSVRSSTDINPEMFENTGTLTTKYTDAIRDSAATSQNSGQTNVQTVIITDTSSSVRPSTRVYSETFEKSVTTPLTSSGTVITSKKYSEESLKNFSQTTGQTGIPEKFTETSSRERPSTNIYSETFEKTGPLTTKYTDAISADTVITNKKYSDVSLQNSGRTTGQTGISEKFSATSSSVKPSTDIESATFEKTRTLLTKYTGAISDSAGTLQNTDQSLRHTGISEKFTETSSSVRSSTDIHPEIFENTGTLTTKYTDAIRDSAATSQNSGQTNVQTGIITDTSSTVRPSTRVYSETFEKTVKTPLTSSDTVKTSKKYSEESLKNSSQTTGQTVRPSTDIHPEIFENAGTLTTKYTDANRDSAATSQNSGQTNVQTGIITDTSSSVRPSTRVYSETFEKTVKTPLTSSGTVITSKKYSEESLKNSSQTTGQTGIREKLTETSSRVRPSTNIYSETFEKTGPLTIKYKDAISGNTVTLQSSGQTTVQTGIREKFTDTSSRVRPLTGVYSETFEKITKTPYTSADTVITNKKYSDVLLQNSGRTTGQTGISEKFSETSSSVKPSTDVESETFEKTRTLLTKYTGAISDSAGTLQNSDQSLRHTGISEKFTETSSSVRSSTDIHPEIFENTGTLTTKYTDAIRDSAATSQNSGQTNVQTDIESETLEKTRTLLTKYTGAIRDSAGTLQNSDQSLRHTGISEKFTETSSSVRSSTDIHPEIFENTGTLTTKYTDAIRDSAATSQNSGQTNVQTGIITDTSSSVRPSTRVYSETFEKTVKTPLTSSDTVITSKKYSEESLRNFSQTTGQTGIREKLAETSSRVRPSTNIYSETFEKTGPLTTKYTDAISGNTVTLQSSGQTTVQTGIRKKFTDTSSRVRPSTGVYSETFEKITKTPYTSADTLITNKKYSEVLLQNSGQTTGLTGISENFKDTSSVVRPSTGVYFESLEKTFQTPSISTDNVITTNKYSEVSLRNSGQTTGETGISEKFLETTSSMKPSTDINSEIFEKTRPLLTKYTDAIGDSGVTSQNSGQTIGHTEKSEKFIKTSSLVKPSTDIQLKTYETTRPLSSKYMEYHDTVEKHTELNEGNVQLNRFFNPNDRTGIAQDHQSSTPKYFIEKGFRSLSPSSINYTSTTDKYVSGAIYDLNYLTAGYSQSQEPSYSKVFKTQSVQKEDTEDRVIQKDGEEAKVIVYGKATSDSISSTTVSPIPQRSFRVVSRRRPVATINTTSTSNTTQSIKNIPDIKRIVSIEDSSITSRSKSKNRTTQRRPLISLNIEQDQNPAFRSEEEKNRQSKSYSSSFKQNQLNDLQSVKAQGSREFTIESPSAETMLLSTGAIKASQPAGFTANTIITNVSQGTNQLTATYTEDSKYTRLSQDETPVNSFIGTNYSEIPLNIGISTNKYTNTNEKFTTIQNPSPTYAYIEKNDKYKSISQIRNPSTTSTENKNVTTTTQQETDPTNIYSSINERFTETSRSRRPSKNGSTEQSSSKLSTSGFIVTGANTNALKDAITDTTVTLQNSGQTTGRTGTTEKFTKTSSAVRPSTEVRTETFEKTIKTPFISTDTVITSKKYSEVSRSPSTSTYVESVENRTKLNDDNVSSNRYFTSNNQYTGIVQDHQSSTAKYFTEKGSQSVSRGASIIYPSTTDKYVSGAIYDLNYSTAGRSQSPESSYSQVSNTHSVQKEQQLVSDEQPVKQVETAQWVQTVQRVQPVGKIETSELNGVIERIDSHNYKESSEGRVIQQYGEEAKVILHGKATPESISSTTVSPTPRRSFRVVSRRRPVGSTNTTSTTNSTQSTNNILDRFIERTGDSAETMLTSTGGFTTTNIITNVSRGTNQATATYIEDRKNTRVSQGEAQINSFTGANNPELPLNTGISTNKYTNINEKYKTVQKLSPTYTYEKTTISQRTEPSTTFTENKNVTTLTQQETDSTNIYSSTNERLREASRRRKPSTNSSREQLSTKSSTFGFTVTGANTNAQKDAITDTAVTLQNSGQSTARTGISEKFTETSSAVRPSTEIHTKTFENTIKTPSISTDTVMTSKKYSEVSRSPSTSTYVKSVEKHTKLNDDNVSSNRYFTLNDQYTGILQDHQSSTAKYFTEKGSQSVSRGASIIYPSNTDKYVSGATYDLNHSTAGYSQSPESSYSQVSNTQSVQKEQQLVSDEQPVKQVQTAQWVQTVQRVQPVVKIETSELNGAIKPKNSLNYKGDSEERVIQQYGEEAKVVLHGKATSESISSTPVSPTPRRSFRVVSRRRPVGSTNTTSTTNSTQSTNNIWDRFIERTGDSAETMLTSTGGFTTTHIITNLSRGTNQATATYIEDRKNTRVSQGEAQLNSFTAANNPELPLNTGISTNKYTNINEKYKTVQKLSPTYTYEKTTISQRTEPSTTFTENKNVTTLTQQKTDSTNIYSSTNERLREASRRRKPSTNSSREQLSTKSSTFGFTVTGANTNAQKNAITDTAVTLQNSGQSTARTGISEKFTETWSAVRPSIEIHTETFENTIKTPSISTDTVMTSKKYSEVSRSPSTSTYVKSVEKHTKLNDDNVSSNRYFTSNDQYTGILQDHQSSTAKYLTEKGSQSVSRGASIIYPSNTDKYVSGATYDLNHSTAGYSQSPESSYSQVSNTQSVQKEQQLVSDEQPVKQVQTAQWVQTVQRVQPVVKIETSELNGAIKPKNSLNYKENSEGRGIKQYGEEAKVILHGKATSESISSTPVSPTPRRSFRVVSRRRPVGSTNTTSTTNSTQSTNNILDSFIERTGDSAETIVTSTGGFTTTNIITNVSRGTNQATATYIEDRKNTRVSQGEAQLNSFTGANNPELPLNTGISTNKYTNTNEKYKTVQKLSPTYTYEKTTISQRTEPSNTSTENKNVTTSTQQETDTTNKYSSTNERLREASSRIKPSTNSSREQLSTKSSTFGFTVTGANTNAQNDAITDTTVTLQNSGQSTARTGISEKFTVTSSAVKPSTEINTETFQKTIKTPFISTDTVITSKKYSEVSRSPSSSTFVKSVEKHTKLNDDNVSSNRYFTSNDQHIDIVQDHKSSTAKYFTEKGSQSVNRGASIIYSSTTDKYVSGAIYDLNYSTAGYSQSPESSYSQVSNTQSVQKEQQLVSDEQPVKQVQTAQWVQTVQRVQPVVKIETSELNGAIKPKNSLNYKGDSEERVIQQYGEEAKIVLHGKATSESISSTPVSPTPRRSFRVVSRRRPVGSTNTTSTTSSTQSTNNILDRFIERTATSDSISSTTVSSTPRRSFRVVSRRPVATTNTTSTSNTTQSSTNILDGFIERTESVENSSITSRSNLKNLTIKKRPLVSLKVVEDQNPASTNEEEENRQSTSISYSSSFKQNQLDEVQRLLAQGSRKFTVESHSAETILPSTGTIKASQPAGLTATTIITNVSHGTNQATATYFEDNKNTRVSQSETHVNSFTGTNDRELPLNTGISTSKYTNTNEKYATVQNLSPTYTYVETSDNFKLISQRTKPSTTSTNVTTKTEQKTNPSNGYSSTNESYIKASRGRRPSTNSSTEQPTTESSTVAFTVTSDGTNNGNLSPVTSNQPSSTISNLARKKTVFRRISTTTQPSSSTTTTPKSSTLEKVHTVETVTVLKKQPVQKEQQLALEELPVKQIQPTQRVQTAQRAQLVRKVETSEPNRAIRLIGRNVYNNDSEEKVIQKQENETKVIVRGKRNIECLDIGNFPHPSSCKKFITCARTKSGTLRGTEYTCPTGLLFDPVKSICNWPAEVKCNE